MRDLRNFKELDSSGMYDSINQFPMQVASALKLGGEAHAFKNIGSDLVVLGMGGSAIGGDLLRTYAGSITSRVNIRINRNYLLMPAITKDTCVIASSYSGNTEETLSSYESIKKITNNIIVISTGGELSEKAKIDGFPIIKLPSGLQPRAALGYSFFPMLMILLRSGLFDNSQSEIVFSSIENLQVVLIERAKLYSDISNYNNGAIKLAENLFGKTPVFYSSSDKLDTLNLRWRGQIQENAKQMAFGALLPEMNHNEINGWVHPKNQIEYFQPVFFKDRDDHHKINERINATFLILKELGLEPIIIESEGNNLLTRIFDLLHLGDWVSFYLALFNDEDPSPIPNISRLKQVMQS